MIQEQELQIASVRHDSTRYMSLDLLAALTYAFYYLSSTR